MDGFTIIDGVVALVLVVSAILAHSRGIVREIMAIAGWIAAAIGAFAFAPAAQPLVREIPYLDTYLAASCELSIVVAFAAVFAVMLVIVSIFTPLLSGLVRDSALGPIDQVLGFLFGVLRGVVLVALAFLVYDRMMVSDSIAAVEESRSANVFARTEAAIDDTLPEDAPGWIVERYETLVSVCAEDPVE
jgi:membrane protein required for colicin V production